jgi:hypothetical protein
LRIEETRASNIYNLKTVANYYNVDDKVLLNYYEELLADKKFLNGLNAQMADASKNHGFTKGIFGKPAVDSVDWFAFQRVLLYVLIRHLKPNYALETGVYYGGNTAFMLAALEKNQSGLLVSIDLPDSEIRKMKSDGLDGLHIARHPLVGATEYYEKTLSPGFITPPYLNKWWKFIEGSSLDVIPKLEYEFDFYIHDSDHSYDFLNQELKLASEKMNKNGTIIVDDINWSNSFFKYTTENQYYPLLMTDNGKNNLGVRTGLVRLNHPYNQAAAITGGNREIKAQFESTL